MRRVFSSALKRGPCPRRDPCVGILDASTAIDSDFEAGVAARRGRQASAARRTTRGPFFKALATVESDFEHRRVLTRSLARHRSRHPETRGDARRCRHRHRFRLRERRRCCWTLRRRHPIEGALRAPFFRAVDSIDSSFERGRVLQAVLQRGDASEETMLAVLATARGDGSASRPRRCCWPSPLTPVTRRGARRLHRRRRKPRRLRAGQSARGAGEEARSGTVVRAVYDRFTVGSVGCHFHVSRARRRARRAAPSPRRRAVPSPSAPPARCRRSPARSAIAGCPVRFVMPRLALPVGDRNTSYCDISLSISRMSSVRARCARMYSTAGTNRCVRNVFGQVFERRSPGCPALRVRSSNAAAASVLSTNPIVPAMSVARDLDRLQRRARLAIDVQRVVQQLQLCLALARCSSGDTPPRPRPAASPPASAPAPPLPRVTAASRARRGGRVGLRTPS